MNSQVWELMSRLCDQLPKFIRDAEATNTSPHMICEKTNCPNAFACRQLIRPLVEGSWFAKRQDVAERLGKGQAVYAKEVDGIVIITAGPFIKNGHPPTRENGKEFLICG